MQGEAPFDALVAEHARRQHGLISVSQIDQLGATEAMRRARLRTGRWVMAGYNVIQIAGTAVTWESQLLTHVLAAGEGAMASHRAANVLWELEGCGPGRLEIVVPRGRRYRRPGLVTHESTDLHLVEPVERSGIPTTPVARTLLDLGGVLRPDAVHIALDAARRRKLVTWDELLSTLVAHARRGRNGVGTLRKIVDEHFGEVALTESGFERLVVSVLLQAGLPRPVLQHRVVIAAREYRLDLAYPEQRVAIELDGQVHLQRDVWEKDHARQNAFVLEGWILLRFTWRDYRERRSAMLNEIEAALASRH